MGTESMSDFLKGLEVCFVADFGKKMDFNPKRILRSGNRTIVFWADGTKTVVKRSEDEQDSPYSAFCSALAIRVFGSNSAVKRVVNTTELQKKRGDTDS